MSTTSENHPISTDLKHLLEILAKRVSSDPYAPVREYIANAHDACQDRAMPLIHVSTDKNAIHVEDNGRGMTKKVILEAFTRVAGHHAPGNRPTVGMFGVGVLSAFMIAKDLTVETRSQDEDHGWRIEWRRGEQSFALQPINRAEVGTRATLHLADDCLDMASESALRDFVSRNFGLFRTPITVGQNGTPVNPQHRWLTEQARNSGPSLLLGNEARDLLQRYCHFDPLAVYSVGTEDGARIFLGIPDVEHSPLDLHKVTFFSKGILIRSNPRAFFPENLAFVVSLIDHPEFKLQISRESFLEDEVFARVRNSMEHHIVQFLGLLEEQEPRLLARVLRLHQSMLLAHAQREPKLRALFREHYDFTTTLGDKRWRDLVTFAEPDRNGSSTHRVLYVLTADNPSTHALAVAKEQGRMVVLTHGAEELVLRDIAGSEGVRVADSAELVPGLRLDVPRPFQAVAARLANALLRHGVGNVGFVSLPHEPPAMFVIETSEGPKPPRGARRSQCSRSEAAVISIGALMLNVAHPLIEALAGLGPHLDNALLKNAAEVLFCVAALTSPFEEARARATDPIINNLLRGLEHDLKLRPTQRALEDQAKCFVALPYAPEFDFVWESVRGTLAGSPFHWNVVRADEHVHNGELLAGVLQHISTSRRFVADISGSNENVLLELGMMLQKDKPATLILSDEETFKNLPADLRGLVCSVYPVSARTNRSVMQQWFANEVEKYTAFISMQGTWLRSA